jgi:hypothetical protein
MRLHVCACCERGQFDTRMHSGLFTINTLERTVQGLPAPGMERQSSWSHLIDEHRKAAGSVGWTKDAWDGAEEPSEACQLWLKGSKPRIHRMGSAGAGRMQESTRDLLQPAPVSRSRSRFLIG